MVPRYPDKTFDQFVTGNEAFGKARFDQMAARSDAKRVYRTMTLIWSVVLFAKSVMSVVIALTYKAVSAALACICVRQRCPADLLELPLRIFEACSLCEWRSSRDERARCAYRREPDLAASISHRP